MAYPGLSDAQCKEAFDAYELHGGNATRAAQSLGLSRSTFRDRLDAAKRRAKSDELASHIVKPDPVIDGFGVSKVSTLYGPDGDVKAQWVQQRPEAQQALDAMRAAVDAMAGEIAPVEAVAAPLATTDHLCTLYTLTDAHIGMLAWHREGGADWDLDIAERTIVGCFALAIAGAPNAKMAVLNQLGDLLHYDGLSAITPTSGHILDADGRFTKMVEVAVRVLRRVIAMMLAKHDRVHLVLAEGNHDMASSVWLRTMFKALYENEPRISVDDSALPYYVYEHGQTMLVFHHSHLKKNEHLPIMVAAQFSHIWGRTSKRYIHTGNLHHAYEKEHSGVHVIQHPTMAARDAYAARGGWWADRNMSAITYHNKFGQVGRVIVSPEMLLAA